MNRGRVMNERRSRGFLGGDLMGGVGAIVWALGTAVGPDILTSAQGPVHVQLLALGPKAIQAKGGRRGLSYKEGAQRTH